MIRNKYYFKLYDLTVLSPVELDVIQRKRWSHTKFLFSYVNEEIVSGRYNVQFRT